MKKIIIYSTFALALGLAGCTKWLNDTPDRSKIVQEDIYSSEIGIYSVLNGFYTDITDKDLYGGKLSMTAIEMLARYYDFAETTLSTKQTDNMKRLTYASQWNYTTNDYMVREYIGGVWIKAYKTIMGINTFIDELTTSQVMGLKHKNVALGEAYALRALLHMDIYRLYGPVSPDDMEILLPYNNNGGVSIVGNVNAATYLEYLMDDIEIAIEYLNDDPIRTQTRILDLPMDNELMSVEETNFVYKRNMRMNYYAANVLKMRALMLQEKFDQVEEIAQFIIEESVDQSYTNPKRLKNNVFALTPIDTHTSNYILYDEVIFGAYNFLLHKTWRSTYLTGELGNDLVISTTNLYQNMYGIGKGDDPAQTDIRGNQWAYTSLSGQKGDEEADYYCVSLKYSDVVPYTNAAYDYDADDARKMIIRNAHHMQVVMRLSEVYYSIAEANLRMDDGVLSKAISAINTVLLHRGFQASASQTSPQAQLPPTATKEDVAEMLWREYYREFFMEGQTFFYLKRNNMTETLKGNGSGMTPIKPENYIVPAPKSEKDYF